MNADELAHLIRQLAGQQNTTVKPIAYGHIASYDPKGHRVRVVIPSLRDDDPAPTQTGWMPLLSSSVGPGYGMQVAPYGGATLQNPTSGEQVIVGLLDLQRGAAQCACLGMTFNGAQQPPATVLASPLAAGDIVIYNKAGSFWRLHANGDVETNVQGNVIITGTKALEVTITQGATINVAGDASITSAGTLTLAGVDRADLIGALVNLGGVSGGKKIARDGDPVISGTIQASGTTVFST